MSARPLRLVDGGATSEDERAMAALLERLPSPDVDERAVARVFRRVTAPEPRARSFALPTWLLGPVALAVVAAFLWGPLTRHPTPAEVALSTGVLTTVAASGRETALTTQRLREGQRLRSDASGRALLRVEGVSSILVAENSDVTLESLSEGTLLRLVSGSLTARVTKRPKGEPFLVAAGRYTVKVVGTIFTVEQKGDRTTVSVREGVVDVRDERAPVARIMAGAEWSSDGGRSADHTSEALVTVLEDTLGGKPALELARELAGVPAAGAPAPLVPSSRPGPTTEPAPAPASAPPAKAAPWETVAPKEPEAPPPEVAIPAAETPLAPPPAPSALASVDASAPDSYATGVALEAKGDVQGAARELTKAADDPAHADLALYSLGRIEQRRLHDGPRALAAYRRYRTQFPNGALLPEVDFAILELSVEGHDTSGALSEASRFLTTHPSSERALEVRLLRANLLRDSGKCGEALPEYAALAAGRFGDDALYSTAYCQRRMGDRAAAAATLAEYLRRFPAGAHRAAATRAIESGNEIEN